MSIPLFCELVETDGCPSSCNSQLECAELEQAGPLDVDVQRAQGSPARPNEVLELDPLSSWIVQSVRVCGLGLECYVYVGPRDHVCLVVHLSHAARRTSKNGRNMHAVARPWIMTRPLQTMRYERLSWSAGSVWPFVDGATVLAKLRRSHQGEGAMADVAEFVTRAAKFMLGPTPGKESTRSANARSERPGTVDTWATAQTSSTLEYTDPGRSPTSTPLGLFAKPR